MIFNRKKDPEEDVDLDGELETPRRIKRIKPKVDKKELVKPWGKYERFFVLITLILTVGTSGLLALSARNYKLPNIPKLSFSKVDFEKINPFKEETVFVGGKGTKIDQIKIEKIKSEFKEMTDGYSGVYAFYIYDLEGSYYYGVNHQDVMQAASMIKLPLMATVYLESEKGNIEISDYMEDLRAMGNRSDNKAYLNTLSKIGRDKVIQTIGNLGMSKTSLDENKTSAEDIGLFFKKLYKYEILNQENSLEFISLLEDTIFNDWLRRGIPEEIRVSHKYARELRSVSDGGIIFDKKPFVLVIMTDGVIEKEAIELFPKITELLYNYHTNENSN